MFPELTVQTILLERRYGKGAANACMGVTKIALVGEIACVERIPDLKRTGRYNVCSVPYSYGVSGANSGFHKMLHMYSLRRISHP